MTEDTPGKRAYSIRLALGDGWKVPLPMADFAALLSRRSGVRYDSSMVSRIESGDRKLTLDDVAVIASIDPKGRGRDWLAWGTNELPALDPEQDRQLTDEEIARAGAASTSGASSLARKREGGKR